MKARILPDGPLDKFSAVEKFKKAYEGVRGISKTRSVTYDRDENLDISNMAIIRFFIETSDEAVIDQKYVIAFRFHQLGYFVTIDLISLDKDQHRDLALEHANRLNWPKTLDGVGDTEDDFFNTAGVFSGGNLKISDGQLLISDSCEDYPGNIFGADCESITAYISSLLDIPTNRGPWVGQKLVKEVLAFMAENKQNPDFYERWITHQHNKGNVIDNKSLSGLILMKASDNSTRDQNIHRLVDKELISGLRKHTENLYKTNN